MSKARELAELSRTVSDSADATAITINSDEEVTFASGVTVTGALSATGTSVFASLDISGDIDVAGTTNLDVVDIDGAVDMASTLAVGGVVTANAGVVVDNFTLDGTTLALSSGDMTLDVAGDIILDADTGVWRFKDAGTTLYQIAIDGASVVLYTGVSDAAMVFKGNDGGSTVTALTLDMSAAGAATFNAGVTATNLKTTDYIIIQADDAQLYFTNAANNRYNLLERDASNNFYLKRFDGSSVVTDLTFNSAGAATFNGLISGPSLQVTGNAIGVLGSAFEAFVASDVVYTGAIDRASGDYRVLKNSANRYEWLTGTTTGVSTEIRLALNLNGAITTTPDAGGHAVFNEGGVDADFRVESSGNANMLFVDGGNNSVNIGSSENIGGMLNIAGSLVTMNSSYKVISSLRPGGWGYSQGTYGVTIIGGDNDTGGTVSIGFDPSVNTNGGFSGYGQEMIFNKDISFYQSNAADDGWVKQIRMESSTGVIINENGNDLDFRVESDTNTHMLFVDGGNNHVNIGTATDLGSLFNVGGTSNFNGSLIVDPNTAGKDTFSLSTNAANDARLQMKSDTTVAVDIQANGATVFNENGLAANDFRVESDTNTHALFVDAGNNVVGIATASPATYLSTGGLAVQGSTAADFSLVSTAIASGVNSHQMRYWNDTGTAYEIARTRVNVGAGQLNRGEYQFSVNNGGGLRQWLDVDYGGNVRFNEGGHDSDFRVESDSNANMLFVDGGANAVGIGVVPTNVFEVKSSGDGADQITLQHSGNTVDIVSLGQDGGHGSLVLRQNSSAIGVYLSATGGAIFNENSLDADFRVESDGVSNMLQVDAASNGVGIRVDGDGNQSLKIKSTSSTGNLTLIEDEILGDGSYTPYYQYKVAYIAGNSSNTQLTIPFYGRSYNQTGYLKIRVLPALHNLTAPANVATAEFALGLAYPTTVSVSAVLSSSGNYASATGNTSNQLIITFSNAYSSATLNGAFVHIEFFGQQGVQGAPDWNNIAFN
jgi:hypothetical protein